MISEEIIMTLKAHKAWLNNKKVGQCANLSGQKLSGADLDHIDLGYANLSYSDLSYSDLSYSDLSYSDLRRANLSRANLRYTSLNYAELTHANLNGVNLREAYLNNIKEDFLAALAMLPNEVPFLRKTLIDGKINGSVYIGECCCLAGTMAHACHVTDFVKWAETTSFPVSIKSLRERWFLAIRPGMTPDNSQIVDITVEWIDEFLTRVQS